MSNDKYTKSLFFFIALIGGYILTVTTQPALIGLGGGEIRSTEAIIIKKRNFRIRNSNYANLKVQYSTPNYLNGSQKMYTGKVSFLSRERQSFDISGQRITVFYSTKKPQKPFIDPDLPSNSIPWFIIGFCLLSYGLLGFKKQKN